MAIKRSPRYPRVSLTKAIGMAQRLYEGAHQSKVDAETAAKVIGYTNSSSGAAAGALGALRQYGLVDGLRGDMRVSDLAMRILQPMDADEHILAIHEAANRPETFSQIQRQFDGELPKSDAPILAFLVRQLGFSQTGAGEVVSVLRETFADLPAIAQAEDRSENESIGSNELSASEPSARSGSIVSRTIEPPSPTHADELITLPLGPKCKAEVRFIGEVTATSYDRLIRHLELLRETLNDE